MNAEFDRDMLAEWASGTSVSSTPIRLQSAGKSRQKNELQSRSASLQEQSAISLASSYARLKLQTLELPNRTPDAYAYGTQEPPILSDTDGKNFGSAEAHDKLVRLISLPANAPNSTKPTESRAMFNFEEPTVRFPIKKSNVVLEPKSFNRHQISSECVMLHNFIYPKQEGAEIKHEIPDHQTPLHLQNHQACRPSTATIRQLSAKHISNSKLAGKYAANSLPKLHEPTVDKVAAANMSTLVNTEKNSSSSAFVQKLMSHISTKIAASSSVSIMSQKSVIYADKDGRTETSSMRDFSHGAAGLQLALIAKLDSAFQLRNYFLYLKLYASKSRFQRHRQVLHKKMELIKSKNRTMLQQEIDNAFSAVLTQICHESTLELIRCASDNKSWSTASLQRYLSFLNDHCSRSMINACMKLSSLLKDQYDIKSRSLSDQKRRLFAKLLALKKENEAHAVAASDLIELADEFVNVIRYIIAWMHKILINILQTFSNHFFTSHVDVESSLALVCTWSADNEMVLIPDISAITGLIRSSINMLHAMLWNIFKENCGSPLLYENYKEIAPHVISQMNDMITFHSKFETNCFISKRFPEFVQNFEYSFEQIIKIVKSDALHAVNEAKLIEIGITGSLKLIADEQFVTGLVQNYQSVQDSFKRLDLAPSNFHQDMFSLHIENEFMSAKLQLQKFWESHFSKIKQRIRLQIENLAQRISKVVYSLRNIELLSKKDEELIQSAYQLHQAIVRAEEALPQMQIEKKILSTICVTIISCSSDELVQYWEDFDNYIHFKPIIEEIAKARMSMMRRFDHVISIFDSGHDNFSKRLRSLNLELEDIENGTDFSSHCIKNNCQSVQCIAESASQIMTQVSTLLENYTMLCVNAVSKPKGRHSEVVLRRTPQDIFFVTTILAEKSQCMLSNWQQLMVKSATLEQLFMVTYSEACNDFSTFEANLSSIQIDEEELIENNLMTNFLSFHSESIFYITRLYPFLKISIPDIRTAAFKNIMNIIFPANSFQLDASITFGEILRIWKQADEEQRLLILERIEVETVVAEKVNQAQSFMDAANIAFIWKNMSAFQEVRFPQYIGQVTAFVNPDMSNLIASCENYINNTLNILLTFDHGIDEKPRMVLSRFLEDFYVLRSFLQTLFACSYWTCCMLTITFERKGDEDQEDFLTWGGDPDQLSARNTAIKSYKACMVSHFQQCKAAANESMFNHLNYIRQARLMLEDVASQMHAVYENYRDFTFFPMSLTWFPSIILLEEDVQDASILSLGPAGGSAACRCFSTLMKAAERKLFVNVSHITKDKDFGQPSTLTTLCGRSIGVESSTHLFGRSIHLSLLLQARSVKNAFKKNFLQTIHRFNQHKNSSFFQLLSSTYLKDQFLEGIILAALVKLSSVEPNDLNCPYVSELLESLLQVARDAADGYIQSATALASLIIIRDACSAVKLRSSCCWKFNDEDQSLRIEVGSSFSVNHNLEVSSNLDWLMLLACDDSYLIKCLQAVALSPRVLETVWNHREHSIFAHNLASLTGKQLSLRNSSSNQISIWIDAISASKGFGIVISDDDSLAKFPYNQFLANVVKVGSVFWWASKSWNTQLSDIPNVLISSSLLPFLNFSEYEEASIQLDCIYRTFRIIPPQASIVKSAQELPSNYGTVLKSFDKLGCKMIPCSHGQNIVLSKEFVISRANGCNSILEHFPRLSLSNASFFLSSGINKGTAHETIRSWIVDCQKMVISGRSLSGKSTIILKVLKEFVQLGSVVQRFFWNGLLPTSSSIGSDELEFVQFDVLNTFYSNKNQDSKAIAWIDCPDFSTFPNKEAADLNLTPLIIETQCISHLDPASLCSYNHYFLADDEIFSARNVLLEILNAKANECLVRKTSSQKLLVVRRVHQFFMDSLKFVFQHCSFSHSIEFCDMHFVNSFSALMKSYCLQMSQSRSSTFGPSWWKKYNLCSETAFYHMSVFCTIWSIGGCLSQRDQENYDVWVRTLGFEILSAQSLVSLKVPSVFNCILSSCVTSNGLRLEYFQDYELLEQFSALGDAGLFCPSPQHYLFREISRFLNKCGQTVALLGPSDSGKTLFLKSICKQLENLKTSSGCSFVSFVSSSGIFHNIKKLASSFRDSSEFQGSFLVIIDDFHWGLASSRTDHKVQLEVSQIHAIVRSVICNRTMCLVDRVKPNCFQSIALYREPISPSVGMIFGVSTSAPQYTSPLLYSILASAFLLHPHSMQERTFQVLCSRAVDLKLRKINRAATPIVEFSMPIMSSVLFQARDLLVANMKRLLLPHYYDIPSYSYFSLALLRLVDTFGCTLKDNDRINEGAKTKTYDFLAYVRAATSGLQKAKQAVANSSQDEYYLDPSSVWKAFAIQLRDLVSHFLSSHVMFEMERMLEESYFAEVSKTIASAMHSVGCDHGGQLDAILSPIAKYVLGSDPDPNASFILKSLPGDLALQSYDSMWIKYIYYNEEFKFKFMLGIIQQEQNIANSLSQLSGAFHQLAQFLKFQDPLLRIKCYDGADFFNLVDLCESLKVFRYFSVRHIDILDDAKSNFRSEIRDCLQQDLCVLFAINLQINRYLENSHTTVAILHRSILDHFDILHAIIIEKKPSYLFDNAEILELAKCIPGSSGAQKVLSLEVATQLLVSDISNRFRFVIAVDANPLISLSMHDDYYVYRKIRSKSSVCSLFAVSLPTTFVLLRLFQQYNSYEAACKNWKESGLSVAGVPMASVKMQMTGYLLLTASIINEFSLNSVFEFQHVSKFLQQNSDLCNMVCVKSMFHLHLFRQQFAFCIEKLQNSLKGINTIIKIHCASDLKAKVLKNELVEKRALLESLQAKFQVERSVFQQSSNESDQVNNSRQLSISATGPIRVSSLFSSSSYGSSILETSRCLNEIQKLSDAEVAKVLKAIQEPKHVEERLISELFITVFQYSQMGLTPATFATTVADFKYKLAALSVLQLPASSFELMMRFIRNPVLQLSDNIYYSNRMGLKLLMEWIQSIACQVYSRKKNLESPLLNNDDTNSWVASVLKKHDFLEDAASALKEKSISTIDILKHRIQELQFELDPLNIILKSIKSMEPVLHEIKHKAKAFLRKLFILEQFCEEISYIYSLIAIVCLPFCRENQDRFFDIIKDLTSDESLIKVGTVLNTIFSRFSVTVSLENPLSFQFLHSTNLRDFVSLCTTILTARDTQFLFSHELDRFSNSQVTDDKFQKHAVAAMCSSKVVLVFNDPFSNTEAVPSVYADASVSDVELLIKRNEVVFSNTVTCGSELAKFCEILDRIVQNSEIDNFQHVRIIPLSTNDTAHDPLYSMESIQKIKEHGSQFAVVDEGNTVVSDLFRIVLPTIASAVLKFIPLEGILVTGFQMINCYDFEERFTNALTQCLMNCFDKLMFQNLSNIRCSFLEFTSQKLSSLNAIASHVREIYDCFGDFEGDWSVFSPTKIAESICRSDPFAKSYRRLAPLLDACIESLGPCLHFESNWKEVSQVISSSVIWLLSGTRCIASLKEFDWKEFIPKAFLLSVKRYPPHVDPLYMKNYRGSEALKVANQISGTIGENLRYCVSQVAFECSVFFDVVENLIDLMATKSDDSVKRTLVECFECATSLPFLFNIVHASYFYKLQLSMGLREFETSQNAKLQMPRSIWNFKHIANKFLDSHPDIILDNPEYELTNAPLEVRTIFVLLHVLSFQETQIDKYDIENPLIMIADFKISAIPEVISAKRLYIIRFLKLILADHFDLFTENLRLLNTRHAFVEEFMQIHTEVLLSILKRQSFSENDTLVSLLRRLFVPTFDSPHFGFLTSFLLGSTSCLSFIASHSSLKLPAIEFSAKKECQKQELPLSDLWKENCML
jgi:hypothetical protein